MLQKKAPSSGVKVHISIRKVLRRLPGKGAVELELVKLVWPPPSSKGHFLTAGSFQSILRGNSCVSLM